MEGESEMGSPHGSKLMGIPKRAFNEARCKIMAHMTGLVLQISETSLHKPTGYFILNNYVEQTSGKYTVTAQTLFNTGF